MGQENDDTAQTSTLYSHIHYALAVAVTPGNSYAQKAGKYEIAQWRDVLRNVERHLKERYYDPGFRGVDIDARFDLADAKMKEAQSLGQLVGIVAQVLLDLNDSHTYFLPPFNSTRIEEKRAVVIGDRSSGSVMQSRTQRLQVGAKEALSFGVSATNADVIMGDGKSLEHVGVTPDEILLPTAQDMSLHLDPVLSRAATLAGVDLDPKKAGALFPLEWKK